MPPGRTALDPTGTSRVVELQIPGGLPEEADGTYQIKALGGRQYGSRCASFDPSGCFRFSDCTGLLFLLQFLGTLPMTHCGGMGEWLKPAVLKTVIVERRSEV